MSIICGVQLKGSDARLVLLTGTLKKVSVVETKVKKITLTNDSDNIKIQEFRDNIFTFFRENSVEVVAIKARQKGSGQYAGGAVGFKMEAIIQLYESADITFKHPNTIASTIKKNKPIIPKELNKYQEFAFEVAYTCLGDKE